MIKTNANNIELSMVLETILICSEHVKVIVIPDKKLKLGLLEAIFSLKPLKPRHRFLLFYELTEPYYK